ncbi:g6847 [Coccomyxa viridis]|uniref:G6847 protein n=1 Tax=Coccomyxa viridis TaxID=1274662 RepID=A0ABP1FYQ5_9CHLO
MAAHLSAHVMLWTVGALACLTVIMYNPLVAHLWPILTGTCSPVLQPEARWGDIWGMGWLNFHARLVREVTRADNKEGFELVFYGDSISEDWRGTSGGIPWPIGSGTEDVFYKHFGSKYNAEVLAIAGDQIGHLWWRILNGELPKKPPKVFTMLIGTNDLTAADCNMNETELLATVPGIQYRVMEIVKLLRQAAPEAHIVIQGLLPRGAAFVGPKEWKWPNRYTKPLEAVNSAFESLALLNPLLHYVYCGAPLIRTVCGGQVLDVGLLPDGLHPNAAGMDLIAECLEESLAPLLGNSQNFTFPRTVSSRQYDSRMAELPC